MSKDGGFGYESRSADQNLDGHFSSSGSMVPRSKPDNAWAHARVLDRDATGSAPDHVYITEAVASGDEFGFAFFEGDTYHTFYKHTATTTSVNQRLDISPISWSGSNGSKVTFYYGGGK